MTRLAMIVALPLLGFSASSHAQLVHETISGNEVTCTYRGALQDSVVVLPAQGRCPQSEMEARDKPSYIPSFAAFSREERRPDGARICIYVADREYTWPLPSHRTSCPPRQ